jgi:nucleotide-binding universal stress UspA family protein
MAWKTILLKIGPRDLNHAAFNAAAELARRGGGRVVGLHVELGIRASQSAFAPALSAELVADMRRLQAHRAKTLEGEFLAALAAAGVAGAYRHAFGDPRETLATASYYADLIVFDRIVAEEPEDSLLGSVAEDVALGTACPMLFVPEDFHAPERIGQNVAIAWKENREAARAVQSALPFLKTAARVMVYVIAAGEGEPRGLANLVGHLGEHGIKAETLVRRVGPDGEAATLLNMVGEREVDLLVMGAYGRSRLREMVLGGVTRHVFRHTPVPLLTAH